MRSYEARVLFRPPTAELAFLPEGPYPLGAGRFSWVAIQHGADAKVGSLNVFDIASGENRTTPLPGRPGFAFPTDTPGIFVAGLERSLCLVDTGTGNVTEFATGIGAAVDDTVINDGVVFSQGLVFGCKDLKFATAKAGLYLWRSHDRQLIQLRDDQICSNGKVLFQSGEAWTLLDIDTPTKTVVSYRLDVERGELSEPAVVLDLTSDDAFPDGMIATPDGNSVIIAFYNPNDAESGETRQYSIADGTLEAVWRTTGSPQATCPQLVETTEGIKLVMTTAVEHMSAERQQRHTNAGCLFIGDTDFTFLPSQPVFAEGGP